MGSLCCVAARPHGSNAASRDCSVSPREPYWRTNSSFSPPQSRWDFHFQSEGTPQGLHDGTRMCTSSASSNSKESLSWMRVNWQQGHQYSTSNGAGMYLSSPSDLSLGPHWRPPASHETDIDDYESKRRDALHRQVPLTPRREGTSKYAELGGFVSSCSDSGESERNTRLCISSNRNVSSRRFSLSKPVHPLSFPCNSPTEDSEPTISGFSDFEVVTPQGRSWSGSSIDSADIPECIDSELSAQGSHLSDNAKCGLCHRLLSHRSPWCSGHIMRNGDMPITGVLSCRHVFHAECLEQVTPKTRRSDPPCPICDRSTGENSPDGRAFPRIRNGFPRIKPSREDGPSRPWGCVQVGDCVEGALHPPRNTTVLLNRNRIKKNLSSKEKKDSSGKVGKSGCYATRGVKPVGEVAKAGCSKGEERVPR